MTLKKSLRKSLAIIATVAVGVASGCVSSSPGTALKQGDVFLPGSEHNTTPPPSCLARRVVTVRTQAQLRSAVAGAKAGDVITLKDGNYGNATLNISRSGTKAAPICIVAENRHRAVFSGLQIRYSANHVVMKYLKVSGGKVGFDLFAGSNFRLHGNLFDSVSPSGTYLIDVDYSGVTNVNFRWDSNLITNFSGRLMRSDAAEAFDGVSSAVKRQPRPERTPRNMYFDHNYVQWKKGQPKIPGGTDESHAFKIGSDVGNGANQNLHISYNTFKDYPGGSNLFLHWKSSGNYFAYNKLVNIGNKAGIGARSGGKNSIVGNVVHGRGAWFQLDDSENLLQGNYVINLGRTNYGVGSVLLHGNIASKDGLGITRNGSNRYRNSYFYQRTTRSVIRNNVFISNGETAVAVKRESSAASMLPTKNWFNGNMFHNISGGRAVSSEVSQRNGNAFTNNYWSNFSGVPSGDRTFNGSGFSLNPDIATVEFSVNTNGQVPNIVGRGTRP